MSRPPVSRPPTPPPPSRRGTEIVPVSGGQSGGQGGGRSGGRLAPPPPPPPPPPQSSAGLLQMLTRLVDTLFQRPPKLGDDTPLTGLGLRPFIVAIAALDGDVANEQRGVLVQALAGRPGLITRTPGTVVILQEPPTSTTLALAQTKARQVMVDEAADLVVWGQVVPEGMRLYFTPTGSDDNRPASFVLATRMEMPRVPDGTLADLFHAAVLAAIEPTTPAQREMISELVPAAGSVLEFLAKRMPSGLTPRQQVSTMIACGHVCWAIAAVSGKPEWLDRADSAYQAAQKRFSPKDKTPADEALMQRFRAGLLLAKADALGTDAAWEKAIAAHRDAIAALPRAIFPTEWASEQNRLGLELYRLDLKMARTEMLTQAIDCFKAALQVFTRIEQPRRWAEVMHNLAQALQVYGDLDKNVEVLNHTVDSCRAVLLVRTKEADPIGWAATMNTLGTALFLRDKHAGRSDGLQEAELCMRAAADSWRICGAMKMAAVAEKNIAHVQRLAKQREEKLAQQRYWQPKD